MKIDIHIIEYNNPEQLTSKEQKHTLSAINAANSSYSPYSDFSVGAAVLMGNNEIMTGKNRILAVDYAMDLLPLSFNPSFLPNKKI